MRPSKALYSVKKKVVCIRCGNQGAVQSYGNYYPVGMGIEAEGHYAKYKNESVLKRTFAYGGAIPYECLACDNKGYIDSDFGGFEGYQKAFESIEVPIKNT